MDDLVVVRVDVLVKQEHVAEWMGAVRDTLGNFAHPALQLKAMSWPATHLLTDPEIAEWAEAEDIKLS